MKKIKYISLNICLAILIGSTNSCSKMLEEEPKGMINETFLATESGLKNLAISQYFQCRNIVEDLRFTGVYPSDITTYSVNSVDAIEIGSGNTSNMPTLGAFSTFWRHLYAGVNNMNFGLESLETVNFNGSETVRGELSFFRAWFNLMIVESWGTGAHFAQKSTSSILTDGNQQPIEVFYKRILSDINTAIADLPLTSAERGRLTKPAAEAMKTRILLALAGYNQTVITASGYDSKEKLYTEAKQLADNVINNYQYSLLPNFEDIFDVKNEGNAETIWAVQFSAEDKFNTSDLSTGGHGLHRYWVGNYNRSARTGQIVPRMYGHSIYYGREYRHAMMTRYFLKLFNASEDKRTEGTIQTVWRALWNESTQSESDYGVPLKDGKPTDTVLFKPLYDVDEATAQAYTKRGIAIDGLNHIYDANGTPKPAARSWHHTMTKHLDPSRKVPKEEASHKDVIILRLGEIYLNAAECAYNLNDKAGAANYIDKLRERSRKTSTSLPVSASNITLDFLLDERARELGGEMLRWFDLKRTHKLAERSKAFNPDAVGVQDIHELRPVPQSELDKVTNRDQFVQNPGYPSK
ncbi:RagB/SusD family nutrient uptake outer membrane protein [Sphingobacterium hotanense]|uniref:RagB/SusD family nutrient uptake outer membrane protein n=1 Tax=Sphingobacterium hotanense TaxID=649196 RepID=UPI0021A484AF|nr:RagB/SusD family nutrient uptake outer membrane protein [Sphingobacterium hotanense]MCT1525742.1 RagB/SusD family nutrient uptake outer membrane protein [Sphingobacterium hotanense]